MRRILYLLLPLVLFGLVLTACGETKTTTVVETQASATEPEAPPPPQGLNLIQAQRTVASYYSAVDGFRFASAWAYLGRGPRVENEGFANWKAGYATMVETDLKDITPSRTGRNSASVRVSLDAVDLDACGNEGLQTFAGTWTVELVGGVATMTDSDIDQIAGEPPAASCQTTPAPVAAEPASDCHPSYPDTCLDPNASDYDCAGGSGDGPEYVDGPISVIGDDEFGLDSDSDGVACE